MTPPKSTMDALESVLKLKFQTEKLLEDKKAPFQTQIDALLAARDTACADLSEALLDCEKLAEELKDDVLTWFSDYDSARNDKLLAGKTSPEAEFPKWLRPSRRREVEVVDLSLIPADYLKTEPRTKKILSATEEIPGIRVVLGYGLSVISKELT